MPTVHLIQKQNFLHRKSKFNNTQGTDSSSSVAVVNKARERHKRQIKNPARFQSSYESTQSETDSNYYKKKASYRTKESRRPRILMENWHKTR